jgi:integrase
VKRYADKKNLRFLSITELAKLGAALAAAEGSAVNDIPTAILRLLAFTGARKSEIVNLRWSEVDFERSCLRLGDSKTGAKIIALGAPALEVLNGRNKEGEFVFPGASGTGPFRGLERTWRRVRKAAELPGVRIHDLRHSFASIGLAGGAALPIIGALLGHADVKTTLRYAHLADDPVKKAATAIANEVAAAMSGRTVAPMVRLHSKREH